MIETEQVLLRGKYGERCEEAVGERMKRIADDANERRPIRVKRRRQFLADLCLPARRGIILYDPQRDRYGIHLAELWDGPWAPPDADGQERVPLLDLIEGLPPIAGARSA
jgi:hypothetical protein